MKIGIIIPYFGKLPNYFQVFLDSCRVNVDYDWLIFTNDKTSYNYPKNVKCISMEFEECKQLIQSKFDFNIILKSPQKLCDYKCAYGYIFEEYLKEYSWWGYCDLDQVFGNLNHFITKEMLNKYDKLFSLGHLSMYRNTYENNRVFMNNINGTKRYKEVFTTEHGCAFDEWLPNNINEIYLKTNHPVMLNNMCADINPYRTQFTVVKYDVDNRKYINATENNSIFKWENGCVYQIYYDKSEKKKVEFPYIHLQKRKMKDFRSKTNDSFYIIPNRFINTEVNEEGLLKECKIWKLLNYQYIKVKWNSLKQRVKNRNWKRQNVFK